MHAEMEKSGNLRADREMLRFVSYLACWFSHRKLMMSTNNRWYITTLSMFVMDVAGVFSTEKEDNFVFGQRFKLYCITVITCEGFTRLVYSLTRNWSSKSTIFCWWLHAFPPSMTFSRRMGDAHATIRVVGHDVTGKNQPSLILMIL